MESGINARAISTSPSSAGGCSGLVSPAGHRPGRAGALYVGSIGASGVCEIAYSKDDLVGRRLVRAPVGAAGLRPATVAAPGATGAGWSGRGRRRRRPDRSHGGVATHAERRQACNGRRLPTPIRGGQSTRPRRRRLGPRLPRRWMRAQERGAARLRSGLEPVQHPPRAARLAQLDG